MFRSHFLACCFAFLLPTVTVAQDRLPLQLSLYITNEGDESVSFADGSSKEILPDDRVVSNALHLEPLFVTAERLSSLVVRLHFKKPLQIKLSEKKTGQPLPDRLIRFLDIADLDNKFDTLFEVAQYDANSVVVLDTFEEDAKDYLKRGTVWTLPPEIYRFLGLYVEINLGALKNNLPVHPKASEMIFQKIVDLESLAFLQGHDQSRIKNPGLEKDSIRILSAQDKTIRAVLKKTGELATQRKEDLQRMMWDSGVTKKPSAKIIAFPGCEGLLKTADNDDSE